ncbi:hypothetical protein C5167_032881 [Papaver somniferum]|uniref:Secreted protein n=1 Tax=Papaver somniferum TaxID=3469 RepID=A0A4Y7K8U1_PAPSO|nr:hypothetical protein C5167_032881 [Papaver somniferum]
MSVDWRVFSLGSLCLILPLPLYSTKGSFGCGSPSSSSTTRYSMKFLSQADMPVSDWIAEVILCGIGSCSELNK